MNIVKRKNQKGDKAYFMKEYGRGKGEREATGIFIYTRPKDKVEKNHNKQAILLIETKKSEWQLEQQAIGSAFIPAHKFKANFLDYYQEFVENNRRAGNRHLEGSLTHFKAFLKKGFLSPLDVTENLCCRGQDRPFLQFGGTYLEKFGFTMGTPVNMHLEQNKITLTVATDQTKDRQSA